MNYGVDGLGGKGVEKKERLRRNVSGFEFHVSSLRERACTLCPNLSLNLSLLIRLREEDSALPGFDL